MAEAAVPPVPTLPPGACDCHVHVVGPQSAYPMAQARQYTPPQASVADLRAHLARLGLTRAVVVQPSVYGCDNRCLLDSLAALGGAARGVAVLDETVDDAEIDRLDAAGVRGVRINVESAGLHDPQALSARLGRWSRRLACKGWHLQIYAGFEVVAAMAPLLHRSAVPLVLDHFAMVPAGMAPDDPRLRAVLALLRDGPVHVKLSAPYRIAGESAQDRAAVSALARLLIGARPERLLWGSDWPHTHREAGKAAHETSRYRRVDAAGMAADVQQWLPGEALKRQVLVDNPARLYGF